MRITEHQFFHNKQIALSSAAFLLLLLLLVISHTVTSWLPTQVSSNNLPTISVPKHTFSLSDISTWHLMGFNQTSGDLPQTNLQLTLQGVLVMPNSARSSAIIASDNQSGKVYSVGDELPGGAVLDKVLADKVIIKNRGKMEELLLVRPTLQFAPVPPSMW